MLWETSKRYNQESLEEACELAQSMSANMGGTEILTPLKSVTSQELIPGYSRQLFLLTDGQVSNSQQVISHIASHADTCRVFSIGIGHGASTELVEGMAGAGCGTASFVFPGMGETLESLVITQLQQSQQPALLDVKVDWLDAHRNLLMSSETASNGIQYPSKLPAVFNNSRLTVFGLLQEKPSVVRLKYTSNSQNVSSEFPVRPIDTNWLRKLAAKSIIQELEMNRQNYQVDKIKELGLK